MGTAEGTSDFIDDLERIRALFFPAPPDDARAEPKLILAVPLHIFELGTEVIRLDGPYPDVLGHGDVQTSPTVSAKEVS